MKNKIINILAWIAIIIVVIGWAYLLESLSPGTPIQAFFASLLFLSPVTILLAVAVVVIFRRAKNGDPLWIWQEEKPRKLPLWYRILSKIFR